MLKAVILIGGPQKGTRFRPLSLDTPKPLFPIAGLPLIQHHIAACVKLEECKEILIIGSYTATLMTQFVTDMQKEYHVIIRYLQEFTALGTGGGLYHFRDQVRAGNPSAFFLLNGDVCADFPLKELWTFHEERPNALVTIMGTEATRQQSIHYGCMVSEASTKAVTHYVEKPNTYVSTLINCGVYVCSLQVFHTMAEAFQKKQDGYYSNAKTTWMRESIDKYSVSRMRANIFSQALDACATLARINTRLVNNWWSQVKTAGSTIYANRHYLELNRYKQTQPPCQIIPDVFLHPTAVVDSTAVIGPNVSIGAGVTVKAGVRIKESIILNNATIKEHALVMYSIVGQDASVGEWSVEGGTPSDPDPNKPFAKMDNRPLFNTDGRLNPSITILGVKTHSSSAGCSPHAGLGGGSWCVTRAPRGAVSAGEGAHAPLDRSRVRVLLFPGETILLNSIVLPHKLLTRSFKHEIIL
ncbi:Mannose-1-phosphate guanyltransferase alpha-A [Papilio machaon]|uniref:Mannose-1-phosphate guanyltransferase alpha-A n=1 Tax=Papilio machaon TaxID=76193 RepID=A0A0N1IJQ9_PAPMA|nr:Mannose-1-phosphate guanyltransferase alpha-A [Papilio machaon]